MKVKLHDIEINDVTDCGDEVAAWLSKYFPGDHRLRLVHTKGKPDPAKRPIRPKWSLHFGDLKKAQGVSIFSDVTPYMMLSRASVEDIKGRVSGKEMTVERFRPNVLVKTDSGIPYEEDGWKGEVRLGDEDFGAVLRYGQPCIRCLSVQVDPDTGEADQPKGDNGPMKALKLFRQFENNEANKSLRNFVADSPKFGVHYNSIKCGRVSIGDVVYVRDATF